MRKIFTSFIPTLLCVVVLLCSIGVAASFAPQQEQDDAVDVVPIRAAWIGDDGALLAMTELIQSSAGFSPDTDYLSIMADSCLSGDHTAGREAAESRNKKIDALSLDLNKIDYDDLHELSKIITSEAGSSWLPYEWKLRVGEVVLNRVASPEFPDSVYAVIHQKGQYAGANGQRFANLVPSEDCVQAAAALLSGERLMNKPSVVFQGSSKCGSGVYLAMYDPYYGYTYLCYSSHPALYQ